MIMYKFITDYYLEEIDGLINSLTFEGMKPDGNST